MTDNYRDTSTDPWAVGDTPVPADVDDTDDGDEEQPTNADFMTSEELAERDRTDDLHQDAADDARWADEDAEDGR